MLTENYVPIINMQGNGDFVELSGHMNSNKEVCSTSALSMPDCSAEGLTHSSVEGDSMHPNIMSDYSMQTLLPMDMVSHVGVSEANESDKEAAYTLLTLPNESL